MDTKEVADHLGTTARVLRQFLRSSQSSFVPVGSGARYDFTDRELPTIKRRFEEWHKQGKPRPTPSTRAPKSSRTDRVRAQTMRDAEVWAEEGPVEIPDIRNPQVRAQVREQARAAETLLELRLLAAGLHITQMGNRKTA